MAFGTPWPQDLVDLIPSSKGVHIGVGLGELDATPLALLHLIYARDKKPIWHTFTVKPGSEGANP
jgi:hypothetical protein